MLLPAGVFDYKAPLCVILVFYQDNICDVWNVKIKGGVRANPMGSFEPIDPKTIYK